MTDLDSLEFSLDHISLRVANYRESLDWYQRALGLELLTEWEDSDLEGVTICHLRFGQTKLELIGGGEPSPRPEVEGIADSLRDAGVVHLCLEVEDLARAVKILADRGVEIFGGPVSVPPLEFELVLIKDNSGNIIEIAQRGD